MNGTIENCFDFLPEYLTGEMTPYEAALAGRWLGLEYAVACHYTDKAGGDVVEFENILKRMRQEDGGKAPVPVILKPGETFEYTPKNS
ncbi:hypothetical protein SDC9_199601 [bioreactor metagenome]|uniref:Uncharacterized protein n=1 Tax=bioreactor metagenome TaxID=1076179 RepID=A0A645ILH4_9ZZZZ